MKEGILGYSSGDKDRRFPVDRCRRPRHVGVRTRTSGVCRRRTSRSPRRSRDSGSSRTPTQNDWDSHFSGVSTPLPETPEGLPVCETSISSHRIPLSLPCPGVQQGLVNRQSPSHSPVLPSTGTAAVETNRRRRTVYRCRGLKDVPVVVTVNSLLGLQISCIKEGSRRQSLVIDQPPLHPRILFSVNKRVIRPPVFGL